METIENVVIIVLRKLRFIVLHVPLLHLLKVLSSIVVKLVVIAIPIIMVLMQQLQPALVPGPRSRSRYETS